ncbi:similar to Saccharomyces cerevisiae YPL078C ATP4 Subunit b of the stator stalk of mitochondrial F1F0 ATP synthase [Geotrichum candidum]|uniref:ATP synthase subunit 4 n=1 Tax=Geotrichum candidum TaxID=1173061 RepID=A0A0J9X876_GEOCN|nr:similar to Saccharomyces cerevisiae YPL078C ATP4 Subunit b of the stator stalk of mitochondrial F1F0 ATP synthase [Geotrichum candidum]
MSLRIASRSLVSVGRPALVRPVVGIPTIARAYSSQPDPQAKASSILSALPGSTIVSKTGILATATAAGIYTISNGLYVVNAETCIAGVFGVLVLLASKTVAPAYKEWADTYISNVKKVLNQARETHTLAVKERIESVSLAKDVVPITQSLFAVSKETAELEAEAFVLKQKVDFAAEAKSVLDSWVRYEAQVRKREQQALAESVIAKVNEQLKDSQFQDKILAQAVTEVETIFSKA